MEMIFQRLPLLGEKISKNLDDESLVKLRESSKELAKSIDDERFYWIRIIEHYKYNLQAFQENWMIILDQIPIAIVKDLAIATQKFFKAFYICYISPWRQKWSPIHIASQQGNLQLFKYMFNQTEKKSSDSETRECNTVSCKLTPLHLAAREGHLDVYQYIIERVQDKNPLDIFNRNPMIYARKIKMCRLILDTATNHNPEDSFGQSTLHLAAMEGNLTKCKIIMEYLTDKNPRNCYGETPLHFLAFSVHHPTRHSILDPRNVKDLLRCYRKIYRFILKNVSDKNPGDFTGQTPLHVAISGKLTKHSFVGNFNPNKEMFIIILENIDNKNPADDNGVTPKDIAIQRGYLQIAELIDEYLV